MKYGNNHWILQLKIDPWPEGYRVLFAVGKMIWLPQIIELTLVLLAKNQFYSCSHKSKKKEAIKQYSIRMYIYLLKLPME